MKKVMKNPGFEKIVKERYQQMVKAGLSVDLLDEGRFGQISVFIDRKPEIPLDGFMFDTHEVWVGAESVK